MAQSPPALINIKGPPPGLPSAFGVAPPPVLTNNNTGPPSSPTTRLVRLAVPDNEELYQKLYGILKSEDIDAIDFLDLSDKEITALPWGRNRT